MAKTPRKPMGSSSPKKAGYGPKKGKLARGKGRKRG